VQPNCFDCCVRICICLSTPKGSFVFPARTPPRPFARSFYLCSSAAVFVYYMSILIKLPGVVTPTRNTRQTERPKRELRPRANPPCAGMQMPTVGIQMNRQGPAAAAVRGFPDVSVAVEIVDGRRCIGAVVIAHRYSSNPASGVSPKSAGVCS